MRRAARSAAEAALAMADRQAAAHRADFAAAMERFAAAAVEERQALRASADTVLKQANRQSEAVSAELKELRRSVTEFVEKYAWLSGRTALLDRTRRTASSTDVRELRARLDAIETNMRNQQRISAEDRAALSDLLTRFDQIVADSATTGPGLRQ